MHVEKLRNFWKLSAICQFVALFGDALRIIELDAAALERDLCIEDEDGPYIRAFRLSLIKSLSSNRNISIDNMDDFIRRQYTYRRVVPNPMLKVERVWKELNPEAPQIQNDESDDSDLGEIEEIEEQTIVTYLELSIPQRLDVLHNLCEWQFQSDKFRERIGATTDLQMSLWRIDHIGTDADNQIYFFLDDGRLYRCTDPALSIDRSLHRNKSSKKRKRDIDDSSSSNEKVRDDWTCVAATYAQWLSIVDELSDPITIQEKALLRYLREEALPLVEGIENERKAKEAAAKTKAERLELERLKEIMRQEALSTRKRSSRIASLDEKREAERQRAELIQREQELEARARRQAEAELKGQASNVLKTREGRARERELREYKDDRNSRVTNKNPEQAEGISVAPPDVNWANSLALKNAPTGVVDFQQSLVAINQPDQGPRVTSKNPEQADGISVAPSDVNWVNSLALKNAPTGGEDFQQSLVADVEPAEIVMNNEIQGVSDNDHVIPRREETTSMAAEAPAIVADEQTDGCLPDPQTEQLAVSQSDLDRINNKAMETAGAASFDLRKAVQQPSSSVITKTNYIPIMDTAQGVPDQTE